MRTTSWDKRKRNHGSNQRRGMKMKVIWYVKASDEKIKPHFKASEFQCKDKTEELLVSQDLLNILEEIRKHFDTPVIINSGYRTPSWNSKVGGTPNSYHCKGMAADIVTGKHIVTAKKGVRCTMRTCVLSHARGETRHIKGSRTI